MELKQYLEILKRWAWLVVLGAVLGLAIGYGVSAYQTPIYQSATKILVLRAPQERSSDLAYLSDQQLAQTYLQLIATRPVVAATGERVGGAVRSDQVRAQQVQSTQVILITVEDQDPLRAAAIANTLVDVLIEQNELIQAGRYATTEESLNTQLQQVETQIANFQSLIDQTTAQSFQEQLGQVERQITELQSEINAIQERLDELRPDSVLTPTPTPEEQLEIESLQARLEQLQPILALYQQVYANLVVLGRPADSGGATDQRLAQLQTTLALYQQIYLNILSNLETVRLARVQNTPNVVQIEPAVPSARPVRPQPLQTTLLAGAVGLMLALGIIFLVEYLDDTIKLPEDVERLLGLPVIGYIAEMQFTGKDAEREEIYVARQPRSPVSEAFRSLRTNLEFAGVNRPLRTLLITSTSPGDGKTTIATNLAAIISQSGRNVVLLDGDLRRPRVHRFLGIPNRAGLSDLFREVRSPETVMHQVDPGQGLRVITSGSLPPNPTELLASARMTELLDELTRQNSVVIIDSPPTLVADAQVLAARVDGVILVIHPGKTHADAVLATLEQLKRAEARVVGVVFNRIPRNRAYYYGGYRYYSGYYQVNGYYGGPASDTDAAAVPSGLFDGLERGKSGRQTLKDKSQPGDRRE